MKKKKQASRKKNPFRKDKIPRALTLATDGAIQQRPTEDPRYGLENNSKIKPWNARVGLVPTPRILLREGNDWHDKEALKMIFHEEM